MTADTEEAWIEDDGGRAAAGFGEDQGSCVCRAVTIASGLPYKTVYDMMRARASRVPGHRVRHVKRPRHGPIRSHIETGLRTSAPWFRSMMVDLGFRWVPRDASEGFPETGRNVVLITSHAFAMIDGVIHDTHGTYIKAEVIQRRRLALIGWWASERDV